MWEKALSILGGSVFTGIAEIIGKVVTDPTKLAELTAMLNKLEAETTVKLAELAVSDRNSARQREMTLRDWTPSTLAWLIVIIFAAAQWYVFTHSLPTGSETLVARVLGTLDMALGLVLGYYFGSSASSEKKTEYLLKSK
jgi:hypothetical protein